MPLTHDKAADGFFERMQNIDHYILTALHDLGHRAPDSPSWTTEIMRDFTAMGGTAFLTMLTSFVVLYLLSIKRTTSALRILLTVISGTILSNTLKAAFARPRPETMGFDSFVVTASFPSGHAMISTIVYLTLGLFIASRETRKSTKIFILFCAALLPLLTGTSRLYLGVHWPTDVMAGWLLGGIWAVLLWKAGEHICHGRAHALEKHSHLTPIAIERAP